VVDFVRISGMNERLPSYISTVIEMADMTVVLQALGDPVRLAIVRELVEASPRACGTFGHLGVSDSTLSHHFRVLREAGLIETTREGPRRLNELRREAIEARYPGLLDAVLSMPA
jgi:DNA-binding transcriptional ArsR family regulator